MGRWTEKRTKKIGPGDGSVLPPLVTCIQEEGVRNRRFTEEMVVTSFSQPTTELIVKSCPCTGVIEVKELTDGKKLLTGDLQEPKNPFIELEQISSRSESSDDSINHQDTLLRIRQCSGKQVCPKQRSGELCSQLQCCHLCTGSFCRHNQLPEHTFVPHPPQTHGHHHTGSSDNNSDSDNEQLLSGWHNMGQNHRLPYHGDEVEVDHGGSGRPNTSNQPPPDRIAPFHQQLGDQMPDILEEENLPPYSVQESSSHLSKQKEEMVLGIVPLLLRREEKQKREAERQYCNVKHVFSKPFVCNMPPFVGEQYT